MKAKISKMVDIVEFETSERCFIAEVANDTDDATVSIARARVSPGVITAWHSLKDVAERYILIQGSGLMEIADLPPTKVSAGDVVRIPPGAPQRIQNLGDDDLIFFVVCNPRFTPECYEYLDDDLIPYDAHLR